MLVFNDETIDRKQIFALSGMNFTTSVSMLKIIRKHGKK